MNKIHGLIMRDKTVHRLILYFYTKKKKIVMNCIFSWLL